KPATTQYPSTPGFISNHWYGRWGQVNAINNEGFSGGPLFFYPAGKPEEVRVAGVVSKFRVEYENVIDENGEPTGMTVPYNTGFLIAYGSKYILSIIATYRKSRSSFKTNLPAN
ncbi:hypothetical protein VDR74_16140, partial [Xanthomonas campestris pv. campestris]